MSAFGVFVYAPPNEPSHWQGLWSAATGIWMSFSQLDVCSTALLAHHTGWEWPDTRMVMFNAHRLPQDVELPANSIIFNAEQIPAKLDPIELASWTPYFSRLRKHQVWDYSQENINRLRQWGCERVAHCPIGYYPGLQTVVPAEKEDIDVLFVGSLNPRRLWILNQLGQRRLSPDGPKLVVQHLFGVYGEELDRAIARAKIVLNMHYYENPIFEIFRVSHLLANKKCVVSESGSCDSDLEKFGVSTTEYVSYDKLSDACVSLLRDADRRKRVIEQGHFIFSKIDQTDFVRYAIADSK